MFQFSPRAWLSTGLWLTLGFLVYRYYAEGHEQAVKARQRVLRKIEQREYRILVAMSNPDTMPHLMELATVVARTHQGSIVGLGVVEVFEDEPLTHGIGRASTFRPLLAEAGRIAEAQGVPFSSVVKISHRVSFAVVETVREEECNFVVLGRGRQPTLLERFLSSVVERVLREAPCEVAIVQGPVTPEKVERIFLPISESANARLAMELAPAVARHYGAEIRPVTILPPELTAAEEAEYLERLRQGLGKELPAIRVVRSSNVPQALMRESRGSDLILLGVAASGFLAQLLFYPPSLELADRVRRPLAMLRKHRSAVAPR